MGVRKNFCLLSTNKFVSMKEKNHFVAVNGSVSDSHQWLLKLESEVL